MAATATMANSGSARKRLLKEEDMTKVEFETSEEVDVTPTFDTMGLREDLLRGIYAYGGRARALARPGAEGEGRAPGFAIGRARAGGSRRMRVPGPTAPPTSLSSELRQRRGPPPPAHRHRSATGVAAGRPRCTAACWSPGLHDPPGAWKSLIRLVTALHLRGWGVEAPALLRAPGAGR